MWVRAAPCAPSLPQGRLQHPRLRLASPHQQIRRGSAGRLRAGLQLEQVRRGQLPTPPSQPHHPNPTLSTCPGPLPHPRPTALSLLPTPTTSHRALLGPFPTPPPPAGLSLALQPHFSSRSPCSPGGSRQTYKALLKRRLSRLVLRPKQRCPAEPLSPSWDFKPTSARSPPGLRALNRTRCAPAAPVSPGWVPSVPPEGTAHGGPPSP